LGGLNRKRERLVRQQQEGKGGQNDAGGHPVNPFRGKVAQAVSDATGSDLDGCPSGRGFVKRSVRAKGKKVHVGGLFPC
jgi:hypothetical protein